MRSTARAEAGPVRGMWFSYSLEKMEATAEETRRMEGVYYVQGWLSQGELAIGDELMQVLIGGDIRPHAADIMVSASELAIRNRMRS